MKSTLRQLLPALRAALLAAVLVAAPAAGPGAAQGGGRAARPDSVRTYNKRIQEQEAQLQKLRRDIQDLRKRDRELHRRETNTAKQLREAEREAALTADLLRSLETKQSRLEVQLEGIRAEHEAASEELAERKERLGNTLRAMYVRGQPRTADVLLRTTSMRMALSHFKYLGVLARNNEKLLEEIRTQEAYLAATDARLTQTLAEGAATAAETREERDRLTQTRKARKTALQRVRQQRAEYQRALKDLSESEKKVQSFIAVLEKRRQAALAEGRSADVFPDVGFVKLRGRMPWPTRGRVSAGFGTQRHPKHGTETFNSGIDIAAPEGEPVRAVARGQVEYVDWRDGYGRMIILSHGAGYYTVYAHLSETTVTVPQAVEPGEIIGRVGDTGSLDGPKLHFEVRDKANAVDPRAWLAR
jgi:murein DD-endopeptidase MepM/ murein hydrolase activator NlpD